MHFSSFSAQDLGEGRVGRGERLLACECGCCGDAVSEADCGSFAMVTAGTDPACVYCQFGGYGQEFPPEDADHLSRQHLRGYLGLAAVGLAGTATPLARRA